MYSIILYRLKINKEYMYIVPLYNCLESVPRVTDKQLIYRSPWPNLLTLRRDTRFQHAFTACSCVFKVLTLVWANQRNFFENAQLHSINARWKRLSQLSFMLCNLSILIFKTCNLGGLVSATIFSAQASADNLEVFYKWLIKIKPIYN